VRTVRSRVVLGLLRRTQLAQHRSDRQRVVKDLSRAADRLNVSRFIDDIATHHERMIRPGIWIVAIIRDIHGQRPVQTGTVVELQDLDRHLDGEQAITVHLATLDCHDAVVEDRLDELALWRWQSAVRNAGFAGIEFGLRTGHSGCWGDLPFAPCVIFNFSPDCSQTHKPAHTL
jgi:hypothetical protein